VHNVRNTLAALGAACLVMSCAPAAQTPIGSGFDSKYIGLTVKNDNWLDVAVFVVRAGSRFRIGDVVGNSTRSLRIPTTLIVNGSVQLMADPIGLEDTYVTDVMLVASDQRVQLTVAPRMRMSTYAVWAR